MYTKVGPLLGEHWRDLMISEFLIVREFLLVFLRITEMEKHKHVDF